MLFDVLVVLHVVYHHLNQVNVLLSPQCPMFSQSDTIIDTFFLFGDALYLLIPILTFPLFNK